MIQINYAHLNVYIKLVIIMHTFMVIVNLDYSHVNGYSRLVFTVFMWLQYHEKQYRLAGLAHRF